MVMMGKRIFGLTVSDLIDNIIDHNSIIALWEQDSEDPHYNNLIWKGEGWKIPDPYIDYKFIKIFSALPDSVKNGDVINNECKKN